MHIYIDESGSINNHSNYERYFVIALIKIIDKKKVTKAYKRFVSSNAERLKELDKDKFDDDGNILLKFLLFQPLYLHQDFLLAHLQELQLHQKPKCEQ